MSKGVFVGFGFGAIQGGLFAYEAYRSGRFGRIVVAEVRAEVVQAVRHTGGRYRVNVATRSGLEIGEVAEVEIFNPNDPIDRPALLAAIRSATELCTALPTVDYYDRGTTSVAQLLAEGLRGKPTPCVLYAAENHWRAPAILEGTLRRYLEPLPANFQVLGTVIGKMSGVVADAAEIAESKLAPLVEGLPQALLVEEFNRILVSRILLPNFQRGLAMFEEKRNLVPFHEAKLYGHNATHALLGYLANQRGCRFISEVAGDLPLMQLAREAFLEESGRALVARRYDGNEGFTKAGYRAYAEDLLERMVNPWLRDAVARVIRDPRRKLKWDDRLIGVMRLGLDAGITPHRFARGAAAALALVAAEQPGRPAESLLDELWPEPDLPPGRKNQLKALILSSQPL